MGAPGDFEQVEERAAPVVADDDLQPRPLLPRRHEQPAGVVQQREVADEQARESGAAGALVRDGDAGCGAHGAVDAGEAAVGHDAHAAATHRD